MKSMVEAVLDYNDQPIPVGGAGDFVYALLSRESKDSQGYVKFGISSNIGSRIRSLRTSSPIRARFACILECSTRDKCSEVEKALHKRFASRRAEGEWFRFNFNEPGDKAEFNSGCKEVFACHFYGERYWVKVSFAALDRAQKELALVRSQNFEKLMANDQLFRKTSFDRRKFFNQVFDAVNQQNYKL